MLHGSTKASLKLRMETLYRRTPFFQIKVGSRKQVVAHYLYLNRSIIPRTLVQIPPMLLPHPASTWREVGLRRILTSLQHRVNTGKTQQLQLMSMICAWSSRPGSTGSKLVATPRNGNHYLLPARRTLTNSTSTSSSYSFNVLSILVAKVLLSTFTSRFLQGFQFFFYWCPIKLFR